MCDVHLWSKHEVVTSKAKTVLLACPILWSFFLLFSDDIFCLNHILSHKTWQWMKNINIMQKCVHILYCYSERNYCHLHKKNIELMLRKRNIWLERSWYFSSCLVVSLNEKLMPQAMFEICLSRNCAYLLNYINKGSLTGLWWWK